MLNAHNPTKKLYKLFMLAFLILACQAPQPQAEKPNILFLFADDLSYTAVHALGNSTIHTPNLDRLINSGTTFTHAYNMGGWHGAICMASRTMLMSGRSLWRSRNNHQAWRDKDSLAIANTWGRIMARNGYDTYMSGKWHVAAAAELVFDEAKHIRPGMPRDTWPAFMKEKGEEIREKGIYSFNLKEIMPVGYHRPNDEHDDSWSPSDTTFGGFWAGGQHWSEVLKDDALGYLQTAAKKDKPFFMYLAFNAPHDPRQAPQSFIDQYPVENIPLPESFLPEYPWKDSIGNGPGLRDEALGPYPRTEYAIRTHIQEYYAIITHLDEQVGKILDALEASGKMDNTYIFFSADHGLSVGRHGLLGKQSMFDHSMRVPLMISGPDIPKGKQVGTDVYLQDLMATALELAMIEKPAFVEFNSLLGLAKEETNTAAYDAIYGAYIDLQRMIRKDGYKLIVYPRIHKVLLFDLNNDPNEINDLAGEAAQASKVKELFEALMQLQKEMDDELDLSEMYRAVNN